MIHKDDDIGWGLRPSELDPKWLLYTDKCGRTDDSGGHYAVIMLASAVYKEAMGDRHGGVNELERIIQWMTKNESKVDWSSPPLRPSPSRSKVQ